MADVFDSDITATICWRAQCDAAFKITMLGCPAGNIDLGCENFEARFVNFYGCPPCTSGDEFLKWLEEEEIFNANETFQKKLSNEERIILAQVFYLYYEAFIGSDSAFPPLQLRSGKFGAGVYANRELKKDETFNLGMLNDKFVKEEKLIAFARMGCLTTCMLEDEHYSREICGPIRYVNHSCRPNCHTSDFQILEVQKKIAEGEELLLYYFDNSDTAETVSFLCKCVQCAEKESSDD